MEVGNVRRLDLQRGIGLIEPEDGPDLMFIIASAEESATLRVGHAVMFESYGGGDRLMAGRVTPL